MGNEEMLLRVYFPRAEDMYYVKAKPSETKALAALDAVEVSP